MIIYAPAPTGFFASEEAFLIDYFHNLPTGIFVDIGAFDGLVYSNTRALWKCGWSGVLIEPDPGMFVRLQAAYPTQERVSLLNIAVAREDGVASFAQHVDPTHVGWHSLDPGWVATWPKDTARYIEVTTRSIKSLLASGEIPHNVDLLSVDTEGMDYEIIASMPADFRPRVIVAEVDKPAGGKTVRELLDAEMERRSYRFAWGNYLNSIYLRS